MADRYDSVGLKSEHGIWVRAVDYDELREACVALYKFLLTVPHMEPPMQRFSIPDEVWEPFQDALFDVKQPHTQCTSPEKP